MIPSNRENRTSPSEFCEELSTLLETLCSSQQALLITGDFNLHVDVPGNHNAESFIELLQANDLNTHHTGPTHSSGHNLDLIISRSCETEFVTSVSTHNCLPSDHAALVCNLQFDHPKKVTKHVTTRKLKSIDMDKFHLDISDVSSSVLADKSDVNNLVNHLCTRLRGTLDNHAPVVERDVILRPDCPWYSDSLREAKRERRRCERQMLKTSTVPGAGDTPTFCQTPNETFIVIRFTSAANRTYLTLF